MKARRIPVPESGDINEVIFDMEPGDYCGPVKGYTADKDAVFFVLPDDGNLKSGDRGIHHITSPPHVFTEQPDGSLEIRESILSVIPSGDGWHGYLDRGNVWRRV